jgi:hypothetical protein
VRLLFDDWTAAPKVIWLRRWAHPTNAAEDLLRRSALRIAEFARDPEPGVLILDNKSGSGKGPLPDPVE